MSLVPIYNAHARRAAHPGTILTVQPDSIAEVLGIRPGDLLVSINGHKLRDQIDYRFYGADESLSLRIARGDSEMLLHVEKEIDEDLGVEIPELGLEDISECNNHCPFCFVTQLPKGMRATLHIKDDDYRFSFLNASFVTLTNLSDDDWQRIAEQRLSPLYLSVHSTNPDLRARLLGNRKAPDILEQIDRLAALGVTVHTQLVLCPGINSGEDLDHSVQDLIGRYPAVRTIAAVPVGLTKIRTERTASAKNPLRRFTESEASGVIDRIRPYQRANRVKYGEPVVYLSDEFYLLAKQRVPGRAHYTDLVQLENGVGMVRLLQDAWRRLRRRLPVSLPAPRRLTLACGTLIYPVLAEIVSELNQIANLRVELHAIVNRLFGDEVTVSGLIAGEDLIAQLGAAALGELLIVPRVMFDREGRVTLDDVTVEEISARLGVPLRMADGIGDLEELLA